MKTGANRMYALGRLKAGQMNKTESMYSSELHMLQLAGMVAWFKFEAIKLRLADNTFFTPDFAVMLPSGEMQLHEVKGYMMDDANVKIKVAAEMYPFRFFVCRTRAKKMAVVFQSRKYEQRSFPVNG